MKKILVLLVLALGFSTVSFAQSAGKGKSEKKGKRKLFQKERKPRKQMSHFDSKKKDPNMKNNGTAYRRNHKKEYYTVDGDGFGAAKQKR